MEDILARYIDGELSDAEALELLRQSEQNPELARELHDYEIILGSAEALSPRAAPAGFADKVMAEVHQSDWRSSRSPSFSARWAWLAAAATLVLGLGLGFLGGRSHMSNTIATVDERPPGLLLPASLETPKPGVDYLRAAQLVYTASHPNVRTVSVAGSFNGWDPVAGPMTPDGNVWKILLVLPPGTHEYMFIEDGEKWITDPHAPRTRPDGFGGSNGVLNVSL